MRSLLTVAAVVVLAGCARAKIVNPTITPAVQTEAAARSWERTKSSRSTALNRIRDVVHRVDRKVLPAAISVCQRTFSNPYTCYSILSARTLEIYPAHRGVNAFIGENFDVSILGGLVQFVGTDDELAAVMAHEYAHGLMGHVSKALSNAAWAGLAGLAAGVAIGAKADPQNLDSWGITGLNLGQGIGFISFSKGMEAEADHLAVFILHEAGYDLKKGSMFFVRALRKQTHLNYLHGEGQQVLGFLRTHPHHTERLEDWVATEEMIANGHRRPRWKK